MTGPVVDPVAFPVAAPAADPVAPLGEIPFVAPDGRASRLSEYAGKVVLVVNVASKCGLTPQYEGLQRLYAEKSDQGFVVLGFPANDFMGQEPGTDAEIAEFCSANYAVTFPIMSKISVVGERRHPLYAALTRLVPAADGKAEFRERLRGYGIAPSEDPEVLWNFEKFLVARDGTVIGRFAPSTAPDDPALRAAIGAAIDAGIDAAQR